MSIAVETVDPETAKKWLAESNYGNRQLSQGHVTGLAGALERGEWQTHHQGIAFSPDGRLLDGQHRLAAIVQATRSAQLVVARGVDPAAFSVMDTGKKRTARDILFLKEEKRAQHLAASLRGLHMYRTAPKLSWSGPSSMCSHDQLLKLLTENPRIREALDKGFSIYREVCLSVTAATVGWYVTSTERPDVDQSDWYEGLVTGANLKRYDPRLTLRNTMLALKQGKSLRKRDDSRAHLAFYLKAWNAWAEGRTIKLLRQNANEALPPVSRAEFGSDPNEDGRLV
ncbi:hypothetical protein J0670_08635 [Streptomyces sp. FH025]|nr:hypothetical protein [Streptomyces sp. FH025]